MVPHVDVIVGTDVLQHFEFSMNYGQCFLAAAAKVAATKTSENLKVAKYNFDVNFDGKMWVAKWNWKGKPLLCSRTSFYKMSDAVYPRFESESNGSIDNGWLVQTSSLDGGVIPLMNVVQEKKNKDRSVLYLREFNQCAEYSWADTDVCDEKLRS